MISFKTAALQGGAHHAGLESSAQTKIDAVNSRPRRELEGPRFVSSKRCDQPASTGIAKTPEPKNQNKQALTPERVSLWLILGLQAAGSPAIVT
jgi:hypothetical protein